MYRLRYGCRGARVGCLAKSKEGTRTRFARTGNHNANLDLEKVASNMKTTVLQLSSPAGARQCFICFFVFFHVATFQFLGFHGRSGNIFQDVIAG